jgi:hypothetical protein
MPRELAGVLRRALAIRPADLYPAAEALRLDLDAWLAGNAVSAAPEQLHHRLLRAVRRHPALMLIGALLAVVALASAAVISQIHAQLADGTLPGVSALRAAPRRDIRIVRGGQKLPDAGA